MFGLFKKKKKKQEDAVGRDKDQINSELRKSIDEELEKEKKRTEKKKKEGPNTPALLTLIISIFVGGFFWAYGKISQGGIDNLVSSISLPSINFQSSTPDHSENSTSNSEEETQPWEPSGDVIIFEK